MKEQGDQARMDSQCTGDTSRTAPLLWGRSPAGASDGKRLIRVFPRRTKATPSDPLVRFGPPDMFDEADEVHVSVTFTWDKPKAERLAEQWSQVAPTKIGGVAYRKLVTYTLVSEGGSSLRAAGFKVVGEVRGRSWSCKTRPRVDKHPTQAKLRWEAA